jgi:hypothetical protein
MYSLQKLLLLLMLCLLASCDNLGSDDERYYDDSTYDASVYDSSAFAKLHSVKSILNCYRIVDQETNFVRVDSLLSFELRLNGRLVQGKARVDPPLYDQSQSPVNQYIEWIIIDTLPQSLEAKRLQTFLNGNVEIGEQILQIGEIRILSDQKEYVMQANLVHWVNIQKNTRTITLPSLWAQEVQP